MCVFLIRVASLRGFYHYSESMGTLASRENVISPGDAVRVKVKFADVARQKVEFEYLETTEKRMM